MTDKLPDMTYVLFKEDGLWVSHALEMDVVAQGNDPVHALHIVQELVEALIGEIDPNNRRHAPPEHWPPHLLKQHYKELKRQRDKLFEAVSNLALDVADTEGNITCTLCKAVWPPEMEEQHKPDCIAKRAQL